MVNADGALIISADGEDQHTIALAAKKCGLETAFCSNLQQARYLLQANDFKVVLCDEILADGDYRGALQELRKSSPTTPLIVLSRTADWTAYLHALAAGAFDYIFFPPATMEAERIIWCALADTAHSTRALNIAA